MAKANKQEQGLKVVYIQTAFYGDFIWSSGRMLPAQYSDYHIEKTSTDQDMEEAKIFMQGKNLQYDSIELLEIGNQMNTRELILEEQTH